MDILRLTKINICEKIQTLNFINKKDPPLKEELSTLVQKSKPTYYAKYFETHWNNIKNRKRIKSQISQKIEAYSVPTVVSLDNGETITNPDNYDITNSFNNYFASIV